MLVNPIPQDKPYTAGAGIDIANNVIEIEPARLALIDNAIQTQLTGGDGIDVVAGAINIDAAHMSEIDGAVQEQTRNIANGFAGLDAQAAITGRVKVSFLTRANADAIVPAAGELIVTSDTKELRYGDNESNGGYTAGFGGTNTIYISCSGTTALENGANVIAAYALAKTMTPYGLPLSPTNRVTILLGYGEYDLNNLFSLDASFIDIVGLNSDNVRVYTGGGLFRITATCLDHRVRNITWIKPSNVVNHNWQWTFPEGTLTFIHENLIFEGITTDIVFNVFARQNPGVLTTLNGIVRNVKTQCSRLYSSNTSHTAAPNNFVMNMLVENCEGGTSFIGNTTTANKPVFSGTLLNCKCNTASNNNFEMTATTRIIGCDWSRAMNYCATGARIERTTFRTGATASLGGLAAGQSLFVAHCTMAVANHATLPITNTAGTDAQAMNVRSDA